MNELVSWRRPVLAYGASAPPSTPGDLTPSMQAIMLALDRKEREREMVSVLLAELHPRTLSEEEIGEGFTAIMLSCEVTACFSSCRKRVSAELVKYLDIACKTILLRGSLKQKAGMATSP